ncbi:hypothetical protein [Streptomyces sp. NRRL F-5123]|uniref:hypothetical protein n=1 Tax=Streptomyces sp. NRRL F-5123 TaxID=1463856 RepID=UPI0004E0C1CA|nr:hypothetical protein [Streptomyces sp. NRRL F-5123]
MTRTLTRFAALRAPIDGAAAAPATARSAALTTHAFAPAGEIAATTLSAHPDTTNTSANPLNPVPIGSSLTPDAAGLNGAATTDRG